MVIDQPATSAGSIVNELLLLAPASALSQAANALDLLPLTLGQGDEPRGSDTMSADRAPPEAADGVFEHAAPGLDCLPVTSGQWLLPAGRLTLPALLSGAAAELPHAAPGPFGLPRADGHGDRPFGNCAVGATPGPPGVRSPDVVVLGAETGVEADAGGDAATTRTASTTTSRQR